MSTMEPAAPQLGPVLVKEKIPAASDSDTATRQTVEKMCQYISAGVIDNLVRAWAECAKDRYAQGRDDPTAKCWGVYWLLKHSVEFARDEPRLFRVGEPGALDLLIAPAVLVRMSSPKEDCDGFTMLACALLTVLGVKCCIVTIAADPSDPSRWSHVFPMALLPDGGRCPLDASHGKYPGWMVPQQHIYRWQAWGLDGKPINAEMPTDNSLHGYVRPGSRIGRMGLGQDDDGEFPSIGTTITLPPLAPVAVGPMSALPDNTVFSPTDLGPGAIPGGGIIPSTPAASTGSTTNWTSILNSLIGGAAKVATVAELPAGASLVTNPTTGAQSIFASGTTAASLTSSLSSFLPIILIGGLVLFAVSALGKGKR